MCNLVCSNVVFHKHTFAVLLIRPIRSERAIKLRRSERKIGQGTSWGLPSIALLTVPVLCESLIREDVQYDSEDRPH